MRRPRRGEAALKVDLRIAPVDFEAVQACLTAEMWADYMAFKAAGLLNEWHRKWAAYLPS
jgi:hypothetical protein